MTIAFSDARQRLPDSAVLGPRSIDPRRYIVRATISFMISLEPP
jgi:hypothetical protein